MSNIFGYIIDFIDGLSGGHPVYLLIVLLFLIFISIVIKYRKAIKDTLPIIIWQKSKVILLNNQNNLKSKLAEQNSSPRGFIHPILLNIGGLEKDDLGVIEIEMMFVSQLIEPLEITRMIGKLIIGDSQQQFDFLRDTPSRIGILENSNAFKHKIQLEGQIIKKAKNTDKDTIIVLEFEIYGKDGRRLQFAPAENDPLNLRWRLK